MAFKAILVLLAACLVQGSVIPASSVAGEWDKEIDLTFLQLKVKYNDITNVFKGGRVFVHMEVPRLLLFIDLDMTIKNIDITKGLIDATVVYKISEYSGTNTGTINVVRAIDLKTNMVINKVVVNGMEYGVDDFKLDTDFKKKLVMECTVNKKAYGMRIISQAPETIAFVFIVDGKEYDTQVTFDVESKKILLHSSSGSHPHRADMLYNPLKTEWSILISGHVKAPIDCKIILHKDLKFGHFLININGINLINLRMDGHAEVKNKLPEKMMYQVTFGIYDEKLAAGKLILELDFSQTQKVMTVTLAPRNVPVMVFVVRAFMTSNYTYELTHKLTRGDTLLYAITHRNDVIHKTSAKWASVHKDTCIIPQTSPIYALLEGTYLGKLLFHFERTVTININWLQPTGFFYALDYTETWHSGNDRAKHYQLIIDNQQTPFKYYFYYPVGPEIFGVELGMRGAFGQDDCTYNIYVDTVKKHIYVDSDFRNNKLIIQLPDMERDLGLSIVSTYKDLGDGPVPYSDHDHDIPFPKHPVGVTIPITPYKQTEEKLPPIVPYKQTEKKLPPIVPYKQTEKKLPPIVPYKQTEKKLPPIVPYKQTEKKLPPIVPYKQTEEKLFELTARRDGDIVRADMLFAIHMPKLTLPLLCTTGAICQWTARMKLEVNLVKRIFNIVPVHSASLHVSKDTQTVLDFQHSTKVAPYVMRVDCPALLPKRLDVTVKHEVGKEVAVTANMFIPSEVKVATAGTVSTLMYETVKLAVLDVNMAKKMASMKLMVPTKPTFTMTWMQEDIMKNQVTVGVELLPLGKLLDVTTSWALTTPLDGQYKVDLIGELPVLGKFHVTEEVSYLLSSAKTKWAHQLSCAFSKGVFGRIPAIVSSTVWLIDMPTQVWDVTGATYIDGKQVFGMVMRDTEIIKIVY